jgi:hypothetical protein
VDNHGGALQCVAYGGAGGVKCPGGGYVATLDYPAYCDVDPTTNTVAVALAGGTAVGVQYPLDGSANVVITQVSDSRLPPPPTTTTTSHGPHP